MPDHVHIILKPLADPSGSETPLGRIAHGIKSYSAHKINRLMQRRGSVWQAGYYDRIIRTQRDFWEKLRYVVENPLRAGLVENAEDYEYAWNRWYDMNMRST